MWKGQLINFLVSVVVCVAQLYYYMIRITSYPFDKLWERLFHLTIDPIKNDVKKNVNRKKRIVIIGTWGGSGKSTLARNISMKHNYEHIELDKLKFGENWIRHSAEKFSKDSRSKIEQCNKLIENETINGYVVEGIYSDPKLSILKDTIDSMINNSDLVVWNDIPKIISLWRKMFRSFKRAIGVVEQGAHPEKLHNVIMMCKKTLDTFDGAHTTINQMWQQTNDTNKFKKGSWPYYY
jgi:adenylate kinase family enzyme